MDTFKGLPVLSQSNQVGTYTTNGNKQVDIPVEVLFKIMKDLPDPPQAFKAAILPNGLLPKNTIMISSDIAEKIDSLIESSQQ